MAGMAAENQGWFAYSVLLVVALAMAALTLLRLREKLVGAISTSMKHALCVGIGLFLALIAFKNAGIVVAHPATLITHGNLTSWPVAMAVTKATCLSGGRAAKATPEAFWAAWSMAAKAFW